MTMISVVVPLHNEAESFPLFYPRLKSVLDGLGAFSHEIIFVDDGSRDQTWSLIEKASGGDPAIKGISFSRNFGQQSALTAGLDEAKGDLVIMMDGDLQHPPELIPQFISKWQEGYDVVYTKRERNEDYGFIKNILAKGFAFFFNRISEVEVGEGVLDFRLISRPVVDALKGCRERNRFFRGLVSWVGFKSTFITYVAPKRLAGTTNYSFAGSMSLAITGIVSMSPRPLYWAVSLGLVVTGISFLYIVYALYVKFFNDFTVPGWASILICVLFLGGVQLVTIGILGTYLAKVYEEVKARPAYIVRRKVGASGQEGNV